MPRTPSLGPHSNPGARGGEAHWAVQVCSGRAPIFSATILFANLGPWSFQDPGAPLGPRRHRTQNLTWT